MQHHWKLWNCSCSLNEQYLWAKQLNCYVDAWFNIFHHLDLCLTLVIIQNYNWNISESLSLWRTTNIHPHTRQLLRLSVNCACGATNALNHISVGTMSRPKIHMFLVLQWLLTIWGKPSGTYHTKFSHDDTTMRSIAIVTSCCSQYQMSQGEKFYFWAAHLCPGVEECQEISQYPSSNRTALQARTLHPPVATR